MTYPGTIPLSHTHLTRLLAGHWERIGSRWRRLRPAQRFGA